MSESRHAVIYGISGLKLSEEERIFFATAKPVGFILFKRNIQSIKQVIELTQEIRVVAGDEAVILVDQEGGRVARFRPPLFRELPAAKFFADRYEAESVLTADMLTRHAHLIGSDLRQYGINVNCAPVVDISFPETHEVIGDRAFGHTAEQVAELAFAMAQGLLEGGVTPVIKHIPGHGRAITDSHLELPIVQASLEELENSDFKAFRLLQEKLNALHMEKFVWAMTAHVVYTSLDSKNPATLSKKVVDYIRHTIGFKGILITDALEMHALSGTMAERVEQSYAAGIDVVLHCNGKMNEMQEIQSVALKISSDISDQLSIQRQQQEKYLINYTHDLELLTKFLEEDVLPCTDFDHTEARFT